MKISIIGAGIQGSTIASILTKVQEVSEIICSDINLDRVKRVVEEIKSDKVSAEWVDAGNLNDLLRVVKGADVVINATLPRFNLKIMGAALKSGAHYVDLATESPSEQLELSDKWREAGLTAVIDQGGPFVMNVLVRHAADRLDRVDEIRLRFGWKLPKQMGEAIPTWRPVWCPEVALTEWIDEPAIYEDGKFRKVPTFSGMENYGFPDPVGQVTVCFVDYEPVYTLPRFIGKGVRYVDCKITPDLMAGALIKMGFASEKPIEIRGVKVAPRDVLLALTPHPAETGYNFDRLSIEGLDVLVCFLAEVKGEKAGEKLVYTLHEISSALENLKKFGTFWAHVAIPVVVTATMLANGEVKTKGVISPECLDPDPFLAKMAEWGITFQERITKEIHPTT